MKRFLGALLTIEVRLREQEFGSLGLHLALMSLLLRPCRSEFP